MSSRYRKYVTYTAAAGVLTLSAFLGGCTKESPSETGNATPSEVNAIQAVPETIARLGSDRQVLPGLNDINLPDAKPAPEYPRIGVCHEIIKRLQQCLADLEFMDNDRPTDYFGEMTQQAVKHFQRQNELPMDGTVGNVTWDAIMSPEAKCHAVSKGTQGDDIERIQQRLYELGHLAIADLVIDNFGDSTEVVVLKLQRVNGPEQDGKMGQGAINLLYSDETKPDFFSYGEESDVVLVCQEHLKELGYLTITPDGAYGEDTIVAVKQLQVKSDQVIDGYLGPSTRIALNSPDARASGLMLGERGDAVTKVQQLLNKYGYFISGNVAGYYGEAMENAVRNLQSRNGLISDGLVGVQTMAKPISSNVRCPAANSGGSGTTTRSGSLGSSGNTGDNGGSGNMGKPSGNTTPPVSILSGGGASAPISAASSKPGSPYIWGAKGLNSFDCSGFVYWCLNQVGVNQSYLTSSGWRNVGRYTGTTNFNDIQAGDIVVARGHVGIAAGGGTAIDASSSNGRVVYRSLSRWRANNLTCAWGIFQQTQRHWNMKRRAFGGAGHIGM